MKKLTLTSVVLGALLLSACGGSDDTDPMRAKKGIIIMELVQAGICETSAFRDELAQGGLQDFITRETGTDTTCATYGKTERVNCRYVASNTGPVNCVIGFNSTTAGSIPDNVSMYETFEILESEFQ
ncbi:MAG: hypothetical protein L3J43_07020 [Sulfurovum sp.]|nr:hypothetical protein [Sulfurovum sp.]